MYPSHSVLLHFLKYKVDFIKQVWSRLHPLFSHHHPHLQGFQEFKRNSPQIWCFSSLEHTNKFACFQVQANFVALNWICWARLQYLVSQYHLLHIWMVTLCSYARVREIKVWPLRVKESLAYSLPFRLSKYLFPDFLETVQQNLSLWNSVERIIHSVRYT